MQEQLREELVEAEVQERRSRPVPQIDRSSPGYDERATMLLDRGQRIMGRFREESRSGLSADEVRSFSFGRAVQGVVTGDWRGAEVERRALSEGTSAAGGYLIPAPIASSVIDRVRNEARVIEAGAQTVPMDANTLGLPRLVLARYSSRGCCDARSRNAAASCTSRRAFESSRFSRSGSPRSCHTFAISS